MYFVNINLQFSIKPDIRRTYCATDKIDLFKVCAADKVTLVDALNGACVSARTTACALRVINSCEVILDLDRAVRTGLFALAASDTSVEANLSDLSSLVMARALDHHALGIVNKVNNTVGAGLGT